MSELEVDEGSNFAGSWEQQHGEDLCVIDSPTQRQRHAWEYPSEAELGQEIEPEHDGNADGCKLQLAARHDLGDVAAAGAGQIRHHGRGGRQIGCTKENPTNAGQMKGCYD